MDAADYTGSGRGDGGLVTAITKSEITRIIRNGARGVAPNNYASDRGTGLPQAAHSFAFGDRNGLPQEAHGGPKLAIRWWPMTFGCIPATPVMRSYSWLTASNGWGRRSAGIALSSGTRRWHASQTSITSRYSSSSSIGISAWQRQHHIVFMPPLYRDRPISRSVGSS